MTFPMHCLPATRASGTLKLTAPSDGAIELHLAIPHSVLSAVSPVARGSGPPDIAGFNYCGDLDRLVPDSPSPREVLLAPGDA